MAAFMRGMSCCILKIEPGAVLRRGNDYIVETKRYVRGLRRKPVQVLYPNSEKAPKSQQRSDEISKLSTSMTVGHKKSFKETNVRSNFKAETSNNSIPIKPSDYTTVSDQVGGLRFEKASPGDKRLARLVSVARSRTYRELQGKILLEGRRLICDALAAGANPQMVFFSSVEKLSELPLDKLKRATLVKVKFEDIKIWSDLVAPQGVIAIFSRPDPSRLVFPRDQMGQSVPLSLICDNVRDPGNLGTILRCAAAAGCQDVLLTKGCVDAWEPKVLRSAMGAHFRLPIFPSLDWKDIQKQLPSPVTVHVADNCSSAERAGQEVGDLEVQESKRQLKAGDYGWVSTRPNRKYVRYEDYDSDSEQDSDAELSLPKVDTRLYHERWAQSNTALVIGGETHGLSLEALQLAEKTLGQRLFIPVVPWVDSLNSAMAASILLFEGRRQLLNLTETRLPQQMQ
ncbi:rRNA methyltransferase 3A, mitochondrial [Osmerus mordax]|uniref:rRNA methyltransferase 3A, mitochondrial n=1 Tax=Osmerus mordax TaxID=8014 RepID=UPI00350FA3D4